VDAKAQARQNPAPERPVKGKYLGPTVARAAIPHNLSFPRKRESSHHPLPLSFWIIGSEPENDKMGRVLTKAA